MKSRTISKIIRMTPEEKRRLEYCAEKMGKTESTGSPEKSISLLECTHEQP